MSQHHDPVHPDSDHLTPEVLADLDLGLLDEASAAHAEQHLLQCPACTELRTDFTELANALIHLPPEPMPDDVWQSLSAALEAEPVVAPNGSATVVPLDARRKRRWAPGIGLVAGVAGIALIGAIVVPSLTGSSDDATTASGDGTSTAADSESGEVPAAAYAATSSGTKYQEAALDAQVTELVAARKTLPGVGDVTTGSPVSPSPSPSVAASLTASPTPSSGRSLAPMATDPAAVRACLEGYVDVPGVQPLAIDIGTWQGQPAAIIVLPDSDPTLAEVWVVEPDCSGPTGTLLYFGTVSR